MNILGKPRRTSPVLSPVPKSWSQSTAASSHNIRPTQTLTGEREASLFPAREHILAGIQFKIHKITLRKSKSEFYQHRQRTSTILQSSGHQRNQNQTSAMLVCSQCSSSDTLTLTLTLNVTLTLELEDSDLLAFNLDLYSSLCCCCSGLQLRPHLEPPLGCGSFPGSEAAHQAWIRPCVTHRMLMNPGFQAASGCFNGRLAELRRA